MTFKRVAVTETQIRKYRLPTRPAKGRVAEKRADAVEVDALEPAVLKQLAEECILLHLNPRQYRTIRKIELEEQKGLFYFLPIDGDEE